jgi:hypothetical protein
MKAAKTKAQCRTQAPPSKYRLELYGYSIFSANGRVLHKRVTFARDLTVLWRNPSYKDIYSRSRAIREIPCI